MRSDTVPWTYQRGRPSFAPWSLTEKVQHDTPTKLRRHQGNRIMITNVYRLYSYNKYYYCMNPVIDDEGNLVEESWRNEKYRRLEFIEPRCRCKFPKKSKVRCL